MAKTRILVADDDPSILKLMSIYLRQAGHEPILASDGKEALSLVEAENPTLVILDIRMPEMNGFEVCRRIRATSSIPIIMLTISNQDEDVLQGLKSGADDYVTKPFSVEVLLARIQAVLRRTEFPEEVARPEFHSGELIIDFKQHQVSVAGKEVKLTATEYKILSLLASNAGRVFTQDQLLEQVWGWEYRGESHILQVTISRLREKIEDNPRNPKYIVTRVGIGYSFPKPAE
jgi:two-component system KDP operon response regulator KdpE